LPLLNVAIPANIGSILKNLKAATYFNPLAMFATVNDYIFHFDPKG
jgi:hypothetical protein